MTITAGTHLGPYKIIAQIGVGGMGEVYRATDTKLKRQVAIKVLPTSLAGDAERLARFQREAEVLASLNHPNIAAIYGLEDADGIKALVMELVEGPTLADRIAQGAIPIDEALPIAKQIAEALEAAHEQGIIHRDLKPANIKVRPDGTVKVLDFGLAKAMEPIGALASSSSQAPTITTPVMMTGLGMILGTAAYMSPEQARGRPLDRRADIWAFGCVLYEMLTGRRAFVGEDVQETFIAIMRDEPQWARLPAALSPAIGVFLRRCVQRDPRQRVQAIGDVRLALEDAFHVPVERTVAPPRGTWRRLAPMATGIILGAVAATGLWFSQTPVQPPSLITRFSLALPEGQTLSSYYQSVALSPDGTRLVYSADDRLYVRPMAASSPAVIPGSDLPGGSNPAVSPDGQSIVFWSRDSGGSLKKIPVEGGAAVTLCPASEPHGMSWGPDGILFPQPSGIMRVAPDGGTPTLLVPIDGDVALAQHPQLLPDGESLLVTLGRRSAGEVATRDALQIVVQSLVTGERTTVVEGGAYARYLPSGHLVYAFAGTIFAVAFDPTRKTVTGTPQPILEGVRQAGLYGPAIFSTSNTGSLVYVPGFTTTSGNRRLELMDRGGNLTPLALVPGPYVHPRVSRDGTRLAVHTDDGREANVWIYELAGTSALRRLTFGGRNRFPVWSSDGQRVAFQSDRDGDLALYWQRADGTGSAERLTQPEPGELHVPESWSPDGRDLLYAVAAGSSIALRTLMFDTKKTAQVGDVQSLQNIGSTFSPDGRWVAYAASDVPGGVASSNRGIYVIPFPATGARYQVPKTNLDYHPVWAPSGKELYYVPGASSSPAAVGVQMQPGVTFGTPDELRAVPPSDAISTQVRGYDVLPDGRFLIAVPHMDASDADAKTELRVVQNWTSELQRLVPSK